MTINYTTYSQLPFPLADEKIADGNDQIRNLAKKLDDRIVMRFASQSALAAAITAPVAGQVAYLQDSKILQMYDGTAWRRVFPTSPQIYSGTATPTSTTGTTGDLYIQYS